MFRGRGVRRDGVTTCGIQDQVQVSSWQRRQRCGRGWSGTSDLTTGSAHHSGSVRRVSADEKTESGTPEGMTNTWAADDPDFFNREAN